MEKFNFKKRLLSMIKLDSRRMFTTNLFYIIVGFSFIIPILILVMTQMMEGSPINDQYGNPMLDSLGNPILMEGFKNVWQMLGSVSGGEQTMSIDITSMCNINMMFFGVAILICLFIGQDFKSGYCKNLFTVRSNKVDYILSKTLIGFVGGTAMILAFFIGSLLGGKISGVSFAMEDIKITNIIMCLLSKIGLVLVFASIFVLMSVVAKQRTWLSIVSGLGIGMLLFMMIPVVSPLNATAINVMLSLIGGILFAVGLGTISNIILNKTNLI